MIGRARDWLADVLIPVREYLHDGSLDDACGALALVPRKTSHDGEADVLACLDELLLSPP
jgi:hypothetical protein